MRGPRSPEPPIGTLTMLHPSRKRFGRRVRTPIRNGLSAFVTACERLHRFANDQADSGVLAKLETCVPADIHGTEAFCGEGERSVVDWLEMLARRLGDVLKGWEFWQRTFDDVTPQTAKLSRS